MCTDPPRVEPSFLDPLANLRDLKRVLVDWSYRPRYK